MLKDRLVVLSGLAKADQKLGRPFRTTDCGTRFEPPTCDTFTWFRGCFFLADPGLNVISRYLSTVEDRFSFPGSLRRGRRNVHFRVPFDLGGRSKPWTTAPQQLTPEISLSRHPLLMLQQRERVLFPGSNTSRALITGSTKSSQSEH